VEFDNCIVFGMDTDGSACCQMGFDYVAFSCAVSIANAKLMLTYKTNYYKQ
jgi:hypothetical protein